MTQIARALSVAERPAFVVGASVARDGAWDEVIELAEHHQARVWVAPMSARNSFPENHALFAGFLAPIRSKIVADLAGHDLILVLGAPVFTYHVEGFGPHLPPGAQLFQITDDPATVSWTPVGMSVFASLAPAIRELLAGPAPVARSRPAARARIRPPLSGSELNDDYLMQQIALLRPAGSIIVEEAPSSRSAMHDRLPIVDPDTFYTCASGGLGHGLPAAIGVALGRPGARVIGLLGDGSSMYSIQGLWTAAQMKLPVTFIIVNNRRYEALIEFGRHFGLPQVVGTDLPEINFCDLGRGQGCRAIRVERVTELDEALQTGFNAPGPTLIEVVVAQKD
jgi:benzoylformate decarboxylase